MEYLDGLTANEERDFWTCLEEIDVANRRLQSHIEHDEDPVRTSLQLQILIDKAEEAQKLIYQQQVYLETED